VDQVFLDLLYLSYSQYVYNYNYMQCDTQHLGAHTLAPVGAVRQIGRPDGKAALLLLGRLPCVVCGRHGVGVGVGVYGISHGLTLQKLVLVETNAREIFAKLLEKWGPTESVIRSGELSCWQRRVAALSHSLLATGGYSQVHKYCSSHDLPATNAPAKTGLAPLRYFISSD
jgi:hypothetical protein